MRSPGMHRWPAGCGSKSPNFNGQDLHGTTLVTRNPHTAPMVLSSEGSPVAEFAIPIASRTALAAKADVVVDMRQSPQTVGEGPVHVHHAAPHDGVRVRPSSAGLSQPRASGF